ncbi:MAG: polymerase III protein [candidate division WS6 bacterium GW2011_GWF2_33_92]|uniref:Polymerase III protein n=1 Tax=candidate division WS6 bacterium GW2011_GWB1_33_6 TaxID=1619088 RepID=A0A0G0DJA6_9BACT|nr:MAG: polymerase III protein [candidate division WS6 bacterium GW2011_GWB1_33_6]KKP56884.1 MAG: polymerase III protein [candidate division WS6 bacterium GW2011_GWF2_33_92]
MIQSTIMTYLIVGNSQEKIKGKIRELIIKLWSREVGEDILEEESPDIHILNGSNLNSIGIEDVKGLQKEMVYSPFKELVQIAIVFHAEKLTTQAQNSFLKTLEESGNNNIYILVTPHERILLPTILSRSLKIYTQQEREVLDDLNAKDLLEMDLIDAFNKIEVISKSKESTEYFLKQLELYFQGILEEKIGKGIDVKDVHTFIQQIVNTRAKIQANGNKRLLLEGLFLDLTREIAP